MLCAYRPNSAKAAHKKKRLGRPALVLVPPSTKEQNTQNYTPVVMGKGRSLVAP